MASFIFLFSFFFVIGSASSASISSDSYSDSDMFKYQGRLLTAEPVASCPIDFEHRNYTRLSTYCNPTKFQQAKCCNAFKEITCPYWEILTDSRFNCASTLFGMIVRYTNDTSDPISSLCHEGGTGLDCGTLDDTSAPTSSILGSSGTQDNNYLLVISIAALLQFVLHLY